MLHPCFPPADCVLSCLFVQALDERVVLVPSQADHVLQWPSRFTDGPAMRPNVVLLPDGRLVVTYELRAAPYGIRARISEDQGSRWSDPFILRSDGGNWDIGYTRNALRADGMMVTVYYFNREAHGARTIEATIWDPYSAFKP